MAVDNAALGMIVCDAKSEEYRRRMGKLIPYYWECPKCKFINRYFKEKDEFVATFCNRILKIKEPFCKSCGDGL